MSEKITWNLWLRHYWGGGWRCTRESCQAKSFDRAMDWAAQTVEDYQLSAMLYTVCKPDSTPEDKNKG